eukprot:TRINITY_DN4898_c0_g1_i2.p1 TRINITY_DN4898_c0_g1~~TRINITY_DN4898_c0_g1_i2.p1  ORF type:complete len:193 (+),score=28.18 TRINITY_DN4898_c0_g1_i2:24-581(+)
MSMSTQPLSQDNANSINSTTHTQNTNHPQTLIKVISRNGHHLLESYFKNSSSLQELIKSVREELELPYHIGMVILNQNLYNFPHFQTIEEFKSNNEEEFRFQHGQFVIRLTEESWLKIPKSNAMGDDKPHVTHILPKFGSTSGGEMIYVYGQGFIDNTSTRTIKLRFGRVEVPANYISTEQDSNT